jgi:hypothetical protein
MASAQKFNRSDYISAEEIETGDGYKMKVGRGGVVLLAGVTSKYPDKTCMIRKKSLEPTILRALRRGGQTAASITVEIKLADCPSGADPNMICCSGAGAGCKIDVIVVQKPS